MSRFFPVYYLWREIGKILSPGKFREIRVHPHDPARRSKTQLIPKRFAARNTSPADPARHCATKSATCSGATHFQRKIEGFYPSPAGFAPTG
jgi:hypothetical protein